MSSANELVRLLEAGDLARAAAILDLVDDAEQRGAIAEQAGFRIAARLPLFAAWAYHQAEGAYTEFASGATAGGEGLARMAAVRRIEERLAEFSPDQRNPVALALHRLEPKIAADLARSSFSTLESEQAARAGEYRRLESIVDNHVYHGGRGDGDWRVGVLLAQAGVKLLASGAEEPAQILFQYAHDALRYSVNATHSPNFTELFATLRGEPIVTPVHSTEAIEPEAVTPSESPNLWRQAPAKPDVNWLEKLETDPVSGSLAILNSIQRFPDDNRAGQLDARLQTAIEILRQRAMVVPELFEAGITALVTGETSGGPYLLGQYAAWAVEQDPAHRQKALACFTPHHYARRTNHRPPPGPLKTFNDWEYQGWAVGEEDWPLANLVWQWISPERLADILGDPIPAPPEHSLQYLIVRRLWLSGSKSFPILEALRGLIERTAKDPAMAPLHDRAMLVFHKLWTGLGMDWRRKSAAAVFEVLRQIGEENGFNPRDDSGDGPGGPPPEEPAPDPDAHLPPAARARTGRIRSLKSQLAHNPADAGAWMDLAGLYREAGDIDAALDAYAHAARHHALFALPHYHRGKIFMERKQFAEARQAFSNAIILYEERGGRNLYMTLERPPNEYVDAYRTRGVAWCHEANYAKGLPDISIAIELRRDDARMIWERGYLHEKAGLQALAIDDYYRAGELYLDAQDAVKTRDCAAALDRLGAVAKANALRPTPAQAPDSDLP